MKSVVAFTTLNERREERLVFRLRNLQIVRAMRSLIESAGADGEGALELLASDTDELSLGEVRCIAAITGPGGRERDQPGHGPSRARLSGGC